MIRPPGEMGNFYRRLVLRKEHTLKELERIESSANSKLKLVNKLHNHKYRKEENLFVADGIRLAEMAIQAQWPVKFALAATESLSSPRVVKAVEELQERKCPVYELSQDLYSKVSDTVNGQGLLLVMGQRLFTWQEVLTGKEGEAPLLAVLDGIQDPGNAGNIIRTADALGCTGVICLTGTVDLFSDKVVRASMGSIFNIPFLDNVSRGTFVDACHDNDVIMVATALDKLSLKHYLAEYNSPTAVVFGNEGNGVSQELMEAVDRKVYIPMSGKAESLNVASAAAIVLYEANRQRAIL